MKKGIIVAVLIFGLTVAPTQQGQAFVDYSKSSNKKGDQSH